MSRQLTMSLAGLLLACSIAWLGRAAWLTALGGYLTETRGGLSVADVVLIPAADYIRADVSIETLQEAARLVREGRAQHFVMSCAEIYAVSECELAQRSLKDKGYPETKIDWLRTERLPDEMEAAKTIRELRQRGFKSAIVLLPNYKARRLGETYRRIATQSAIEMTVLSMARDFDPQGWWRSREGHKRFLEEFLRLTGLL
jgi:hypothetical protein